MTKLNLNYEFIDLKAFTFVIYSRLIEVFASYPNLLTLPVNMSTYACNSLLNIPLYVLY